MIRPDFKEIKNFEEFSKFYWYADELKSICCELGIAHDGTKTELTENIREYYKGNIIKPSKKGKKVSREPSPDCPLLECGFSFNGKFRAYFSQLTGVENFKFNADMAEAWRRVKWGNDRTFTVSDMLNVYYGKSDYGKYDNSACQWNKFYKDFCADPANKDVKDKMKTAAELWKKVRDSQKEKIYTPK